MLHLAAPTPPAWLQRALASPELVLLDHAHCEKKAASTAMNLIFRYGDDEELVRALTDLAREELDHFEQVLDALRARAVPWRRLEPSTYAARLLAATRKEEPFRLVDTLLCCALIEARSCERMKLLSEHLPDAELAALYGSLLASEARHFQVYIDLAARVRPREEVRARHRALAAHEAEVQAVLDPEVRMHG